MTTLDTMLQGLGNAIGANLNTLNTSAKTIVGAINEVYGRSGVSAVGLSQTDLTLYGGDVVTVEAKAATAGALSVLSSDSSVATASISGNTVTITHVGAGEAAIIVELAAVGASPAGQAAIYVKCMAFKPVTWADGTDAEVAAFLQAHYDGLVDIHDYWAVGDTRRVSLSAMSATGVGESHSAQDVDLVLMNEGGKMLSDGVTECAFVVGQKESLATGGYMNSSNTNTGGWKNSARRAWCNNVYKNAIPSTLIGIYKEFINQSGTGGGSSSGVENTTDTFALPAEKEVFGSTSYSVAGEGNQFTWYATSANRIKKMGVSGSANYWWERSPYSGLSNPFCGVSDYGNASYYSASDTIGLSPFGCI